MKNEKYLNFFGDSQNYKLHPPLPNPYNMRGNPDMFTWEMNRQGDGLNGTPDWNYFDGQDEHSQFLGKFGSTVGGWFQRSDDKEITFGDGDNAQTMTWGEIKANPQVYDAYKNWKSAKSKNWWNNFGKNIGSALDSGATAYQTSQTGTNPLLTSPTYTPPVVNQPPPPKEAGLGTEKIIGWVLVGGVVLGLLFYAMKGDGGRTVVVQAPAKPGM